MPDGTATAHLYRPKLATVLHEGYDFGAFRKDAMAALTVAIVALPLSMAIAVASGVSPERGLYTSIIGGFLVSALGGSRYQIGGPAGAFIVLVTACGMWRISDPSRSAPTRVSIIPDNRTVSSRPSSPNRADVAATSTMKAPAGPPIW